MKKTKVILHAAVSMAVCASLIAGSTFALFTSESKTNIAITSGKVSVTAAAELVSGYSAKYEDTAYGQQALEAVDGVVTFTNGGTAQYDAKSNKLTVNNISPGDGVTFKLTATNESNIAIKYQTVVTFVSGGKPNAEGDGYTEETSALYRALEINVGDTSDIYSNMKDCTSDRSTAVSGWTSIDAKEDIDPITVTIELPIEAENDLQGLGCALTIGLYAVQSNGNDTTNQDTIFTYFIDEDSNLGDVFGEAQSGDIVVLNGKTDLASADGALEITEKDLTLDMNGNDFTASADTNEGNGFVIGEGAELTLKNEAAVEPGAALPKFSVTADSYSENGRDPEANYTMRVEGTLNVEGVDFNVEDKGGDTAVYVSGEGQVNFNDTAKVTMTGKDHEEEYENGFGVGMIVAEGADVTLEGTTLQTTGAISPFIVGFSDEENKSTLTLTGANVTFSDMYNSTEHGTVAAGLQAYPGGVINIEGSTVTVNGSTRNEHATNEDYNTNAVALSCVGGGDIHFKNSTMSLDVDDGRAIAGQTITNYYDDFESEEAKEYAHKETKQYGGVFLHAHIYFEGTSEIKGSFHPGESGGGVTMFAAQRNGKQQYCDPATGKLQILEKVLDEGENVYSIIIESGVKVQIDKNDENGYIDLFADDESTLKGGSSHHTLYHEYDGDKFGDLLAVYTYQAINDQRAGATAHSKVWPNLGAIGE